MIWVDDLRKVTNIAFYVLYKIREVCPAHISKWNSTSEKQFTDS